MKLHLRPAVGVSEPHAYAAVDVSSIERRPCVHGPLAVNAAHWTDERIPLRLPNVCQVLTIIGCTSVALGTTPFLSEPTGRQAAVLVDRERAGGLRGDGRGQQ
jgi:hypothetical protein